MAVRTHRGAACHEDAVHPERCTLRQRAQLQRVRHARETLRDTGNEVNVFLIGDAVCCAKSGQRGPQGCYDAESMLQILARHGAGIAVCGTCIDARGFADTDLTAGTQRGSMAVLADWTAWADKVIVF